MSEQQKDIYRALCDKDNSIPIFSQPWWLDAACTEEKWNVVLYSSGGKVHGTLPFYKKRRLFQTILTQPPLTPKLGPWINYPKNQKTHSRLSHEKKVMTHLIEMLPTHSYFHQKFSNEYSNWLPFFWKNFKQSTRYSYLLNLENNRDQVWNEFQSKCKTDIKKAEQRFQLEIVETDDCQVVYNACEETFERQGKTVPYSLEYLKRIDSACMQRNARRITFAKDKNGRTHAAIYTVFDKDTCYYLISGAKPELRNSGATSYLVWDAIQYSLKRYKFFDFEGSMIEPIERFCRGFGAHQTPYHHIYKANSKLLKFALSIQS